jgi:hypothetical protein
MFVFYGVIALKTIISKNLSLKGKKHEKNNPASVFEENNPGFSRNLGSLYIYRFNLFRTRAEK